MYNIHIQVERMILKKVESLEIICLSSCIKVKMVNSIILCGAVSKKLGLKHKCNRNFFLGEVNGCKHKLRKYRLHVRHKAEYIWRAFCIHPTICW